MGLKNRLSIIVLVNLCILIASTLAYADLSGTWLCDDEGTYYIRQIREKIWWYNENSSTGTVWSNVASGEIIGNQLHLEWVDVPKGRIMGSGRLILEIRDGGRSIKALRKDGGFGGNYWKKR